MAKYNVGDVLEITEDFELECAEYSSGEKYTVSEVRGLYYTLEDLGNNWDFSNSISLVDAHPGFRKVVPKVEFKVGDKVRLLEGAHSSPGYSCDTPEKVKERLASAGLDYQTVFEVDQKVDSEGDVHVIHGEKYVGLYLLPEFLVPWVEAESELKEPFLQHMVIGKTYQSTSNDLFYTPTKFDFEAGRVAFDYVDERGSFASTSHRYFYSIEEEFGVLPPVKPECESDKALEELKEKLKPENSLAEAVARVSSLELPETISVDALREANSFLNSAGPLGLESLISLAKRLS